MIRNQRIYKYFSIIFGILILLSSVIPSKVGAQGILQPDNLPAGTTIAGDAIFRGESVKIDGNVDGDILAIASEIQINGTVGGSLIVLGNKIRVNGEIKGTVYAAAVQFDLESEANLNRNLYFGGLSLGTQEGSQIRRDLYSVTTGAQMKGLVDGEVRAIIGPAEFFFVIMEKFKQIDWFGSDVTPVREIANHNPMEWPDEPEVLLAGFGPVLSWEAVSIQQIGGVDWKQVGDWLLERFQEWFVLLAFGLLGLWLMPKVIPGSAQLLQTNPLPAAGWGLLGLVISFNLVGVVVLLLIIIIGIGLFLGMITFWQLAWAFMAIGGFSLGLVSTTFTLFVIYISKAIIAFLVGSLILKRIAPKYAGYKPLALITGLIVYVFAAAIPILGWVIGVIVTVLGLGCAWLFNKDQRALKIGLSNN